MHSDMSIVNLGTSSFFWVPKDVTPQSKSLSFGGLITSILMGSKIPTYSLKRILIPRHYAIFLLLGIGIYVSLLIFYTFESLFFTGLIYLLLIPISFFHYRHINKKTLVSNTDQDDEDVL